MFCVTQNFFFLKAKEKQLGGGGRREWGSRWWNVQTPFFGAVDDFFIMCQLFCEIQNNFRSINHTVASTACAERTDSLELMLRRLIFCLLLMTT